jgi:hypothetical protein
VVTQGVQFPVPAPVEPLVTQWLSIAALLGDGQPRVFERPTPEPPVTLAKRCAELVANCPAVHTAPPSVTCVALSTEATVPEKTEFV